MEFGLKSSKILSVFKVYEISIRPNRLHYQQTDARFLVGYLKLRHLAKFRGDRSNRCRDITISFFQYRGRPPSWICVRCP